MPRVSIEDTKQTLEIPTDVILYDALADQGVELPHGCLSGSCGACRINVISGADKLAPAGVIEQNTIDAICDEYRNLSGPEFLQGKHIRLSCRAKVQGDITILPLSRK